MKRHLYHLVDRSPWPLLDSIAVVKNDGFVSYRKGIFFNCILVLSCFINMVWIEYIYKLIACYLSYTSGIFFMFGILRKTKTINRGINNIHRMMNVKRNYSLPNQVTTKCIEHVRSNIKKFNDGKFDRQEELNKIFKKQAKHLTILESGETYIDEKVEETTIYMCSTTTKSDDIEIDGEKIPVVKLEVEGTEEVMYVPLYVSKFCVNSIDLMKGELSKQSKFDKQFSEVQRQEIVNKVVDTINSYKEVVRVYDVERGIWVEDNINFTLYESKHNFLEFAKESVNKGIENWKDQ